MRPPRRPASHPFWDQLQDFQSQMNRLFDRYGGGVGAGVTAFPAFNVWEEGEQVCVEAEVPGLDLKDLEIYVTGGNQLTLKGERRPPTTEKGVWHRQERAFGRFTRSLTLPFPVDADKVDARLENGVLLLRLSKHESARPRKIPVKA
jgi:HSP20 family protein